MEGRLVVCLEPDALHLNSGMCAKCVTMGVITNVFRVSLVKCLTTPAHPSAPGVRRLCARSESARPESRDARLQETRDTRDTRRRAARVPVRPPGSAALAPSSG